MRVFFTVDTEQDCPPFLSTYRGIEEGLPRLVELLDQKNIKATFFVTGNVARQFPEVVQKLVDGGHEIGSHGNTHARLDKMSLELARHDIREATEILRKFYPVSSFRAPNLKLPKDLLPTLVELGYKVDSTLARHKNPFLPRHVILRGGNPKDPASILSLPVTTTSIILRMPRLIREIFLRRFKDPVVLMVHPWEFVDLTRYVLRADCRCRTGAPALNAISQTLDFFASKNAEFLRVNEFTV